MHEDYFEEAMQRVRTQFLSKPLDTVLHPVSTEVRKAVKEEQKAADEALRHKDEKQDAKAEPVPAPVAPSKMQEKSELDILKSQAIQYELRGDLYTALQTYYKIKRLDPLFPSVDLKIKQLERELQPKPVAAASVPRSVPVQQRKSLPWKPVAVVAGALVVLALLIWGAISLWNNLFSGTPEPTRTSQPVQTPLSAGTETLVFTPVSSETPSPSLTYTVQAGDSCASIALNYGVSVDSLISLNNLDSGCFLVVGQTLKIPEFTPPAIGSTMTGKDGMTLLYVPAGEFTMGSEDGSDDEKPVHKVNVDAFWIDQTEVTNATFSKFTNEMGYTTDAEKVGKSWVYQGGDWKQIDGADWSHPLGPSSGISDIMDHPVVHVSWNDAQAYCSWADRRLPTEAEWEKAASWDANKQQKYVYPWGNDFDGKRLNFCDNNCSVSWADKNSDDGYEFTAPVGTYPNGASPYGALDMAGNVWEWVEDWYDAYPGNTTSDSDYGTKYRLLRGGSWNYNNYFVRSANRIRDNPTGSNYLIGFRCASSP